MASIIFIGSDLTLLEGLAQTLAAAGNRVRIAETLHDGSILAAADPPLIAVVERRIALETTHGGIGTPAVALAPGGSVVLYHGTDDTPIPLPATLQRLTLADLTLPLERQRLVALVHSVDERFRSRGRDQTPTPPETRAI
jgi:hypothetical protein